MDNKHGMTLMHASAREIQTFWQRWGSLETFTMTHFHTFLLRCFFVAFQIQICQLSNTCCGLDVCPCLSRATQWVSLWNMKAF